MNESSRKTDGIQIFVSLSIRSIFCRAFQSDPDPIRKIFQMCRSLALTVSEFEFQTDVRENFISMVVTLAATNKKL